MLRDLWDTIRGERSAIHRPSHFSALLPEIDDTESVVEEYDLSTGDLEAISGVSCIIRYIDAKGAPSERRVTCHRFEEAKGLRYLRGFCHERSAVRTFRADRVAAVIDLHTGEIWEPGALF